MGVYFPYIKNVNRNFTLPHDGTVALILESSQLGIILPDVPFSDFFQQSLIIIFRDDPFRCMLCDKTYEEKGVKISIIFFYILVMKVN